MTREDYLKIITKNDIIKKIPALIKSCEVYKIVNHKFRMTSYALVINNIHLISITTNGHLTWHRNGVFQMLNIEQTEELVLFINDLLREDWVQTNIKDCNMLHPWDEFYAMRNDNLIFTKATHREVKRILKNYKHCRFSRNDKTIYRK